jgi:t-SNARE complex subunit (syntaxin)
MSDSAAFDRQARALEGIERHTHELVKIFADMSGILVEFHETLKAIDDKLEKNKEVTECHETPTTSSSKTL